MKEPIMTELIFDRKRMRRMRDEKNLSLSDVARRGGFLGAGGIQFLYEIEAGKRKRISAETLAKICKGLRMRSRVPLMTNKTAGSEPPKASAETPPLKPE